MKHLRKITPHKHEYQTPKMKVPAILHVSEDLLPEEETFRQIESIACNDCVFHHTAAMVDVHSKPGRKNPTGTVIASRDFILPQVNDSDPNCGMRLVRTNLNEKNTTKEEIDHLFRALVKTVPTKTYMATVVPFEIIVDICRRGTQTIIDHLGITTKNEITNSQSMGNYFGTEVSKEAIFDVIPKLYLWIARFRLGLLGAAGNHFLDMMKVTELVDPTIAAQFNLKVGQYVFLIHTGSGLLGQYTMYTYTPKKREHLSQRLMTWLGSITFNTREKTLFREMEKRIAKYYHRDDLFTYTGKEADMYMRARAAASNFGVANRATITHNISETIKKVLGRDPELDLLYDMPHIDIRRENHYGEDVWVHRSGTSRAFGPSRMAHHPLFSQTGEPAFAPSSMSTAAYLGVGTDDNESSFFSCNHGTGKAKQVMENNVPQTKEELHKKLQERGVTLYNAKSNIVLNQDSSRYKSIDTAIASIKANNVMKIVAKMQPVAVIMY